MFFFFFFMPHWQINVAQLWVFNWTVVLHLFFCSITERSHSKWVYTRMIHFLVNSLEINIFMKSDQTHSSHITISILTSTSITLTLSYVECLEINLLKIYKHKMLYNLHLCMLKFHSTRNYCLFHYHSYGLSG